MVVDQQKEGRKRKTMNKNKCNMKNKLKHLVRCLRKILAGHYPSCRFVSDPTNTTDCVCRRWRRPTNRRPVSEIKLEEPHPMFCFSHGGSEACEAKNKQYSFTCPRCKAAQENACYETPSPNQKGKIL